MLTILIGSLTGEMAEMADTNKASGRLFVLITAPTDKKLLHIASQEP